MATRMQQRRGTAAEWTSVNPVLAAGEIGFETDTGQFKIGDGTNAWADLVTYGNIESLIDAAPETLNTLNEIAAAINDDPAFFTNITQDIADAVALEATARDAAIATAKGEAIADAATYTDGKVSQEATDRSAAINSALSIEAGLRDTAIDAAVDGIDLKIGDATVDGTAGNTITDRISTAVSNLIDGAPGALDTLNEIAAALGDDADYAATITATVADIQQSVVDATVSLNGAIDLARSDLGADIDSAIADEELNRDTAIATAIDAEVTDRNTAISTQVALVTSYTDTEIASAISAEEIARNAAIAAESASLTTTLEGYADQAEADALTSAQAYADQAEADAIATAALDATSKADAAQAAAELTASGELTSHNSATTSVHGIADTSLLATTSDVSTAQTAAEDYADSLAVNYDAAGSASAAQAAAEGHADGEISTHAAVTTNVHGIADTSDLALLSAAAQTFDGNITVAGNLTVSGTTVTVSASDLSVRDNMIYLNQAGLFDLSNAVGDGTDVVYTTSTNHDIKVGDYITVTSANPASFDISGEGLEVTAVTADTITVASTVTDTYVDGGSLRGKTHANPDLGWAAGRYDVVNGAGYAHAGIFRDATDGVFKFFDGYTPEPDESVFIDTAHVSFALADLSVAALTADTVTPTNGVVFSDGTQVNVGVPSITPIAEKTASYTLSATTERDTIVEVNSSSATTLTIPADATVNFPVGTTLDVIQTGTGQVTIAGAPGAVTVNATPGLKLRAQWSSVTLLKRGANNWLVFGDTSA
jgi:hypothetical protein